MTLAELTELTQSEGKWFGEFYRHPKDLPITESGIKVGLIRYHFTYWLVANNQQRMLNTLYSLELLPLLDMSVNDIINTIANALKQAHTSKHKIIDRVAKAVSKEMED